jgi:hypothetical protein
MGNIATPNTPYCFGFQQASLSVGNKTFSTQNPPISYSIDGSTVTVFDALGMLKYLHLQRIQTRIIVVVQRLFCLGVVARLKR